MSNPSNEGAVRAELAAAESEPLLPIEKKLIAWSLGLGVGLLVLLAILGHLLPAT